jgi:hypothetical protein
MLLEKTKITKIKRVKKMKKEMTAPKRKKKNIKQKNIKQKRIRKKMKFITWIIQKKNKT